MNAFKQPAFKLSLLAVVLIAMAISCASSKTTSMTSRQAVLKKIYPLITGISRFFGSNSKLILPEKKVSPGTSVYDLSIEMIDGTSYSLAQFRGKKMVIVNTASDCGYTGQYEELQKLYDQQKEGIVIIGFPANDFKEQEKGTNDEIASFCKKNYGVTFPIAAKTSVVKGKGQHPLFQWLSDPAKNGWNAKAPSWNFSKYVIDEQGSLIGYADPAITPLAEKFTNLIHAAKP